eukprot:CAMPEP_0197515334 /NCGR_PEP_ID=MMETSP1318-20131121/501_1 /TAXON_ID=552666 /ORGANISM="Partenskyella glossopodia, Strain RCC365" /LENGTH=435 /DNA_ID=CAMNT_0043063681 /DNA_START=34 /DNA_END=1341 /DNA_ORIENTATION=-
MPSGGLVRVCVLLAVFHVGTSVSVSKVTNSHKGSRKHTLQNNNNHVYKSVTVLDQKSVHARGHQQHQQKQQVNAKEKVVGKQQINLAANQQTRHRQHSHKHASAVEYHVQHQEHQQHQQRQQKQQQASKLQTTKLNTNATVKYINAEVVNHIEEDPPSNASYTQIGKMEMETQHPGNFRAVQQHSRQTEFSAASSTFDSKINLLKSQFDLLQKDLSSELEMSKRIPQTQKALEVLSGSIERLEAAKLASSLETKLKEEKMDLKNAELLYSKFAQKLATAQQTVQKIKLSMSQLSERYQEAVRQRDGEGSSDVEPIVKKSLESRATATDDDMIIIPNMPKVKEIDIMPRIKEIEISSEFRQLHSKRPSHSSATSADSEQLISKHRNSSVVNSGTSAATGVAVGSSEVASSPFEIDNFLTHVEDIRAELESLNKMQL